MYHKGYVLILIVAVLALSLTPVILASTGKGFVDIREELEKPKGEKCVKDREFMVANHMELLNEWRTMAIRHGIRLTQTENGEFNVSINECFKCHDYGKFCDKCHSYAGVKVYCWTCHTPPGEE